MNQRYKLLLLLHLHEQKVAFATSLSKLVEIFVLENTDIQSVVTHLEKNRGDGVLVIADGWDKLGEPQRQKGSFFYSLLFGEILSLASVLVTSRPNATAPLHRETCISQFIEIHGFNKQSITDYIIQSEIQKGDRHIILEQLDHNPLMESICRVPLICSIFCHVWNTLDKSFPPTMTEISTKVILHVMNNYVWKRGASTSIFNLSEINTLPKGLQDSWWQLCRLAFEASIIRVSPIEYKIKTAGLLEVFTDNTIVLVHFLHPIFQEYLAALYIITQSPTEQLSMLDAIKSQQMIVFWQYIFGIGMAHDQMNTIKHAIHILSGSDCSKSLLSQCAFEARNDTINNEIIKALTLTNSNSIHFGDPKTAYACIPILYVIDNIQGLECTIEINFRGCGLDSRMVGELADILAKQADEVQVKSLDLSNNLLSDDSVAYLFGKAISSFKLLQKLFLCKNKIGGESITAIMTALATSSSQSILQMDLSFNPLTLTGLQALEKAIKSNTLANLEILFIQGSLTTDANINLQYFITLTEALILNCPQLRRLDISSNNLGDSVTPELSRAISKLIGGNQKFDLSMNREYMSEVDKNFVAVMQDCIRRKGEIDHTIAHGVFVGPGRSGKNSLMNRLLGEGPNLDKISPSTGVLESVIKAEVRKFCTVAAAANNLIWKRLEYDEEALELMMTTAESYTAPLISADDIIHSNQNTALTSAVVEVKKTSSRAQLPPHPRPEPHEIIKVSRGSVVSMDNDRHRHMSVSYILF